MIQLAIRGYLVGSIWWPSGAECFKDLDYNLTREDGRYSEPPSLRDHVLSATRDGDFQSCSIACGELVATRTSYGKDGRFQRRVTRSWPLAARLLIASTLKGRTGALSIPTTIEACPVLRGGHLSCEDTTGHRSSNRDRGGSEK